MTEFNPQPLSVVRTWVAGATASGLTVEDDLEEIDDTINSIREYLYNQYGNIQLFDNLLSCRKVQCFPVDCNNPCDSCDDFYWGVTAPQDMAGVEEAWYNLQPMITRSRWYEAKEGISSHGYEHMGLIPMDQEYALENPLRSCSKLKIHTDSRCDDGKNFFISGTVRVARGKEHDVEQVEIDCNLSFSDVVETDLEMLSVDSIEMPADLMGTVRITDEDGNQLVKITKGNTIPRFKRYKVGVPNCCAFSNKPMGHVLLKGSRVFRELTDARDLVEVGSKRVFQHLARMMRYETSSDPKDRQLEEIARVKGLAELKGLVDRYTAKEIYDRKRFNRKSLYRTEMRTRRWR